MLGLEIERYSPSRLLVIAHYGSFKDAILVMCVESRKPLELVTDRGSFPFQEGLPGIVVGRRHGLEYSMISNPTTF